MKDIYLEQNKKLDWINAFNRDYAKLTYWDRKIPTSCTYPKKNSTFEWKSLRIGQETNPRYDNIQVMNTVDENGYRLYPSYVPTSEKMLYCFGCSETYGVSALEEETWPYLLARKLGDWKFKNYGIPGASMETIARTCFQVINSLKKEDYPNVMYFLLPDTFRTECIGNILDEYGMDEISTGDFILGTTENLNEFIKERHIFDEHLTRNGRMLSYLKYTSKVHSFFETVKHFKFLQEFLKNKGIQWYWYTWYFAFCKLSREEIASFLGDNTLMGENGLIVAPKNHAPSPENRAKDYLHKGIGFHDPLTDELVKLYKPQ